MVRTAPGRNPMVAAHPRSRRFLVTACVALVVFAGPIATGMGVSAPAGATTSATDGATRGADNYRSGWYPDQTNLSPSLVSGGTFGQLFETSVNGEVYGQPLVDDGQLLVNTENNLRIWPRSCHRGDPVDPAVRCTRSGGQHRLRRSDSELRRDLHTCHRSGHQCRVPGGQRVRLRGIRPVRLLHARSQSWPTTERRSPVFPCRSRARPPTTPL